MSTAGKVLVVLVALLVLPWIWLYAKVYELNTGYGQQIQRLTKQTEDLEKQIAEEKAQLDARITEIRREQADYDNDLEVLRERISDAEKRDAASREAMDRVRLQLATLEETTRDAQMAIQSWQDEKAETTKRLADKEQEVKTLQSSIEAGLAELDNLRNTFLSTMQQNRELIRRLESASSGRVRRASLVR